MVKRARKGGRGETTRGDKKRTYCKCLLKLCTSTTPFQEEGGDEGEEKEEEEGKCAET
jgi:hypothetical protein